MDLDHGSSQLPASVLGRPADSLLPSSVCFVSQRQWDCQPLLSLLMLFGEHAEAEAAGTYQLAP